MRRASTISRLLAGVVLCATVFTQVALAAFACPMSTSPQQMQAAMDSGDCPMVADAGSKTLCIKTCQDEPQKHDVPVFDAMPPAADAGLRVETPDHRVALLVLPPSPDRFRAIGPPPHKQYERYLK